MIFQKRQDFLPTQSGLNLGQQVRFDIGRTFHIESMVLEATVQVATAAASINPDGLPNIVNRIQLETSDGAQNRKPVDISGPGALEYWLNVSGGLDASTASVFRANPGAGTYIIRYPIPFRLPNMVDPVSSVLLLPTPRFNTNPTLTVSLASLAQMDTHDTTTFALGASLVSLRLIVNRRQVTKAKWPTFNTELSEFEVAYPAIGNNQLYELQIPGSYTGFMIRDYGVIGAGPANLQTRGFIETPGGENVLSLLGTTIRRFQLADIQAENDYSVRLNPSTWNNLLGSAYLDFLSDGNGMASGDFGSVLNANILQASGSRVDLLQDISGGNGAKRKYLSHRVYGKLRSLQF